jgi:hypothetical protein
VQREPADGRRRIELLGRRDEGDALLLEDLHHAREVEERAAQAIDLVDDVAVDLPRIDVLKQALDRRAVHVAAREATVVVSLGHHGPALVGLAEVTQETDLTDVDLVRAALRLRVPKTLPVGLAWEVSILVDGAKAATATCEPGCTRVLSDLAANVSKLAGLHVVGVRLELVAVP